MRRLLLALAIAAAALALRVASWSEVFTARGVRFVADGDPYYHVLRAARLGSPGATWVDPALNFPRGAAIVWPPLFDGLIAAGGAAIRAVSPSTAEPFAVSGAWVPVLLGLLSLLVVAALARRLGASGAVAAAVAALLPAHAAYTVLGRPDQHAAELLLAAAISLAWIAALEAEEGEVTRRAAVVGALLALAYWNWQGSALYALLLCAHAALLHVLGDGRRAGAVLSTAGTIGGLLLLASVAALGPPGGLQRLTLAGVSGFQVVHLLALAPYGLALVVVERVRGEATPLRRAAEALGVGAALLVFTFSSAALRAPIAHGLAALGAAGAWYSRIIEFQPFVTLGSADELGGGLALLFAYFGLTFLALPAVALALRERWRTPAARAALSYLALWLGSAVVLLLVRRRFTLYASAPLALGVALAADHVTARLGRLRPLAAAVLALALVAPAVPGSLARISRPAVPPDLDDALAFLRTTAPAPARPAVLASWEYGHFVQYLAHRPVLASPFGVEDGEDAMEDLSRLWLEQDEGALAARARERGLGAWVVANAGPQLDLGADLLRRAGAPVPDLQAAGWTIRSRQLQVFDGRGSEAMGLAPLGIARLLWEGAEPDPSIPFPPTPAFKVFGLVEGAVLEVAARPGERVSASVAIRTNRGRAFDWTTSAIASPGGVAALRVPYATGPDGACTAGSYRVSGGREVAVPEAAVVRGEVVRLAR